MKVNNLQIMSASALELDLAIASPICVFCGRHSDLALDLIRELIGDYGAQNDPDCIDDGCFVVHADIEIDNKNYGVCYIRNADFMGDYRLAVNFEPNSIRFSEDDASEFIHKCNERGGDNSNVLLNTADVILCDDDRPIFIYDCFDRLDEAIDITPILERLASLDRQIFISVCSGYPEIKHEKVQMVQI